MGKTIGSHYMTLGYPALAALLNKIIVGYASDGKGAATRQPPIMSYAKTFILGVSRIQFLAMLRDAFAPEHLCPWVGETLMAMARHLSS